MKLKLSIFLIWALLAGIAIFFSSCSTIKPEVGVKYFKVVSANDSTFIATSGNLKAMFFRVDCDTAIYVGKIIKVSRANVIR